MSDLKTMAERRDIIPRSTAFELKRMGRVNYIPNDREVIKLLHIII
jgi:hypothetical protein